MPYPPSTPPQMPEFLAKQHRHQTVPVWKVREGDQVEIANWPAMVTASEPWSDYVWSLEVVGHYADGDSFQTIVKIPADVNVYVRRTPSNAEGR